MAKANKVSPYTRKLVRDELAKICFWGTPEKAYSDSGFWEFLRYVKTKDEHDDINPIKPLDADLYKYLQVVWYHMLHLRAALIPKSRQIRMTWAAVIFAAWYARTAPHRLIVFQSKKEDDARSAISKGKDAPGMGRLDTIEQNLPWWLQDPHIISGAGNKVGELNYFPKEKHPSGIRIPWYGSRIIAVPSGPKQVPSMTVSMYLGDEVGLWDDFRDTWSRVSPAVGAATRSKMFGFSSVYAGSEFNDAILEGTDPAHGGGGGLDYSGIPEMQDIVSGMPGGTLPRGIRSLVTPSGTPVLEVHYSADPEKRPETEQGKAWIQQASKDYIGGTASPEWLREMEIDYEASGGTLVFPKMMDPLNKAWHRHLTYREVKQMGLNLYAGYDFGTRSPSAFIVWGQAPDGKWYALWELYEPCDDYVKHCAKIKACPYFTAGLIQNIRCDHSLGNHDQLGSNGRVTTRQALFSDQGVPMSLGRKSADLVLVDLLNHWWADPDNPKAFITEDCWNLKREIQRLKWEEQSGMVARRRSAPEKIMDKDNHAFDASAYILDSRPRPPEMPRTGGGWSLADYREARAAADYERKQRSAYVRL